MELFIILAVFIIGGLIIYDRYGRKKNPSAKGGGGTFYENKKDKGHEKDS